MPIGKLQVVPLGGLGEFGMNCMAIRWGDDIIVIDAGLMFPEAELLGVDIVVPDLSYLIENRAHVRAVVLTHGHEDHIGALPWLLSELNVPVYGTEFTLAYVEGKLEEHALLDDAVLNEIKPGERFKIGPFTINPIQVTHSLVDCVALAIHTPLGILIHTGDFKVDPTPTDNRLFDLHAFAEYGKEGVLALFQDSTNVERKGYTPSERAVRARFQEIFSRAERRLFITCFSSSIHRIKLTIDQAFENGRKVSLVGRSMMESAEIAQDLGYLEVPDGLLIHPAQIRDFPPEKVCVLISGTQGEPMSALSRAAVDNHKHARIQPGDTVVLSSRIIPGNEKAIYRVVDHLFRRDAHVIYDDGSSPPVHVSGHASQEELKLIINLVKPQYFIPIHGEYRQLKLHAEMAGAMHSSVGKVIMIESGDILEFDELGVAQSGQDQYRPRLHRFQLHGRRGGGPGDSRPPPSQRRRHRAAHHRHQQADRQGGKFSGDRDARLRSQHERGGRLPGPGSPHGDEHARVFQRRREGRLRHDQGEDSPGPEALHREEYLAAPADYAGDSGSLSALYQGTTSVVPHCLGNTRASAPAKEMRPPMKNPVHPGQIVRHDCLEPLSLSVTDGAKILGVTRQALNSIVNGKSGISPEMALLLTKAFGSTPETWIGMQVAYDLAAARSNERKINVRCRRIA